MSLFRDWMRPLPCFRYEPLLLLLVSVSLVAAGWMTLHRDEGYSVVCEDESDLYHLAESPRIAGFSFDAQTSALTLQMAELDTRGWTVSYKERKLEKHREDLRIQGTHPVLPLELGLQHFDLLSDENQVRFQVRTQWVPGSPPVVNPTPIRVGESSPFSVGDFVMRVDEQDPEEIAAAREVIAGLSLDKAASDQDKISLLVAALEHALEPHRGSPTDRMKELTGIGQYSEAVAGLSEVFCANHAEIFWYLANVAGLPTRTLDVSGTRDGVSLGAHTFNETYIPSHDQWIYIDLQLKTAGIRDATGHYLSAAELIDRLHYDDTDELIVRAVQSGIAQDEKFDAFDGGAGGENLRALLSSESTLVFLGNETPRFRLTGRLNRLFISPRPALCAGGNPHHTGRRLIATYLGLGLGLAWLILRLRHLAGLCRCKSASSAPKGA